MLWLLLAVILGVGLFIDLFLHRKHEEVSIKDAVIWSVIWISLALGFNLFLYFDRGSDYALLFLTGYLIEKALSVDNLFVFLLIFGYFKTPKTSQHEVLFYGVLGAIVMRIVFIFLGIGLIELFHWMIYIFGLILIYSGIKIGFEQEIEIHPEENPIIRLFRSAFPVAPNYVNDRFFVRQNGVFLATPLVIVLLAVETSDLIFAVDSIPAILAITRDPFLVVSSNIFAILGLRSLYFVLSHMMALFHYLRFGLAFVLCFVGVKMLLADVIDIPITVALGVILLALICSILASILFPIRSR